MVTRVFRKCFKNEDESFSSKTQVIAYSKSLATNTSQFHYEAFLMQYYKCIKSYHKLEREEDYYHTPTGDVKDCVLIPEATMSAACLSGLCGINEQNHVCDWVV